MADLLVPRRDTLQKTSDTDPLDFYYGITAPLYRGRLVMAARLLDHGYRSLLDVGYGSGIFFPELARRAHRLAGVERHGEGPCVAEVLLALGVEVELRHGSVLDLPFENNAFECVVCVSVLEHIHELDLALRELRRVLVRDGVCVLAFPVHQPLTHMFFRVWGYDPRVLHPSSHAEILAAARRNRSFEVERVTRFPRFLPLALAGYAGCRLRAV